MLILMMNHFVYNIIQISPQTASGLRQEEPATPPTRCRSGARGGELTNAPPPPSLRSLSLRMTVELRTTHLRWFV